ncbi:MAG TPA: polysaccharide deacetylase family protein [Holophagaceae bacterium]
MTDPSGRMGVSRDTRLPAPPAPPRLVPEAREPRLVPLERFAPRPALSALRTLTDAGAVVARANTLILYDTTGPWGFLGEFYAEQTANLVSRFGLWRAAPVASYLPGQMSTYTAVVYIGSTYDEPLPPAFLADVRATSIPVVWMYDNIWQLTVEYPDFAAATGWMWTGFDLAAIQGVLYKGTLLERDPLNGGGILGLAISDPAKAQPLAMAQKADGTSIPWGVQSGNLFYFGEIPYSYVGPNDRYLAFADLLYTIYAPTTPTRHRALVRIEDVGPDSDPAELRAVTDALYLRKVPFSVAVYPAYRDPNGIYNGGVATSYNLVNRKKVVDALKYMQARGGTLVMHGYTHQYTEVLNPYTGASADDFEFYTAHIDAANNVVYDGPVPVDSRTWATNRVKSGISAFTKAGVAVPTIFELPHYAASAADYKAILALFPWRYDRGLYFGGLLRGGVIDYTRLNGQYFPYPVTDLYGFFVVPENLGNVEPEWFNNHPPRFPADILATAGKNLVIRDGFASFFYHPYLGTAMLTEIVDGLKAQGWTFVSAGSVAN